MHAIFELIFIETDHIALYTSYVKTWVKSSFICSNGNKIIQ